MKNIDTDTNLWAFAQPSEILMERQTDAAKVMYRAFKIATYACGLNLAQTDEIDLCAKVIAMCEAAPEDALCNVEVDVTGWKNPMSIAEMREIFLAFARSPMLNDKKSTAASAAISIIDLLTPALRLTPDSLSSSICPRLQSIANYYKPTSVRHPSPRG